MISYLLRVYCDCHWDKCLNSERDCFCFNKGPNERGSIINTQQYPITYIIVSDILQWIDQFSDQGPEEDDDHHKWVDVLPQNGQDRDPTGTHRPSRNIAEKTGERARGRTEENEMTWPECMHTV